MYVIYHYVCGVCVFVCGNRRGCLNPYKLRFSSSSTTKGFFKVGRQVADVREGGQFENPIKELSRLYSHRNFAPNSDLSSRCLVKRFNNEWRSATCDMLNERAITEHASISINSLQPLGPHPDKLCVVYLPSIAMSSMPYEPFLF